MQDWLPPWGGVHRATCSQDTGQGAIKNISRGASTALFRRPVTCRGRQHRALEMKTLFLGVTLGLAAALSFTLEEEDITGTWYVKAMVVDKDFPEDRRPRKVSPVKVTALGSGNLEATFTFMREDRCIQKKILMRKTEEPGKFSAYGGRKLMYLQELPGRDHYVFYCKDQRHGGLLHMGKLVGILIPTGRPWKNLRNWCSARHSRRRTFSRPCRREAAFSNTRQPLGLHLQSPPYHQTQSPDHLDLPSSHDPSLLPPT
ncbi:odorant-binding protein 2b isoform X2 [Pan troglodytes]|uniref:odorant-binding protein 2b isoform X2 n=1 Tax=Pan troglodytes TaxID=9598 RepID=UPI0007DB965F|nr:odorant-binding protein 2b isoform X1 [Pan troglodytes]